MVMISAGRRETHRRRVKAAPASALIDSGAPRLERKLRQTEREPINNDVAQYAATKLLAEACAVTEDVMESFKSLQDEISKALVSTTRSATRIAGADIAFQRSLNPDVGATLDAQNERLLQLAQRLLESAAASSDAVGPKLPDVESIDGNWRAVVDVIDSLLEKADTSLDEYTGVVKRLSPSADPVSNCMPDLRLQRLMKCRLLRSHDPISPRRNTCQNRNSRLSMCPPMTRAVRSAHCWSRSPMRKSPWSNV